MFAPTDPRPAASARPTPDTAGLAAALGGAGLRCDVEADGALALLRPISALPPLDRAARRRAADLAREYGFTHVALEIEGDGDRQPARER